MHLTMSFNHDKTATFMKCVYYSFKQVVESCKHLNDLKTASVYPLPSHLNQTWLIDARHEKHVKRPAALLLKCKREGLLQPKYKIKVQCWESFIKIEYKHWNIKTMLDYLMYKYLVVSSIIYKKGEKKKKKKLGFTIALKLRLWLQLLELWK